MYRYRSLVVVALALAGVSGQNLENDPLSNDLEGTSSLSVSHGRPDGQAGSPVQRLFNLLGTLSTSGTRGQTAATADFTPGKQCDRLCDGRTRSCYFRFVVERYTVLSPACRGCVNGNKMDCLRDQCVTADGVPKPIITANRAVPGTPVVVCKGDEIVVDIENMIKDGATTIHWHGQRQRQTPFMDGVPMVTQCPIQPFTTFRYRFNAADSGTFFWHSHMGTQKLDGLGGPLIVRDVKANEVHRPLYDQDLTEHVIFVQDWINQVGEIFTPGQDRPETNQVPDAVLINGRGPLSFNAINSFVPLSRFTVRQGLRYRFRLISATCMTCSFTLKIQSHRMTVITADGGLNFKPTVVDSIGINSADRFDFILNANQAVSDYYISVESNNDFCRGIRQVAVLSYKGSNGNIQTAPPVSVSGPLGTVLNLPTSTCNDDTPNEICLDELSGEYNAPSASRTNANYVQIPVAWGAYLYTVNDLFAPGTYQHYEEPIFGRLVRYTINNISFASPPSPMYSQFSDIPLDSFCSPDCYQANIEKSCYCTDFYTIPLNSIVDLIVYDTESRADGFDHAFHLHGYNFFVMTIGTFKSDSKTVREEELARLRAQARSDNLSGGIRSRAMKDSLTIPAGGYAVLRFVADNPGYWFLHCHFMYHLESGMATVYKVGEHSQMPPVPADFPKCGNFLYKN